MNKILNLISLLSILFCSAGLYASEAAPASAGDSKSTAEVRTISEQQQEEDLAALEAFLKRANVKNYKGPNEKYEMTIYPNKFTMLPLHGALNENDVNIGVVRALLSQRADCTNFRSTTGAYNVLCEGRFDVAELLLDHGAPIFPEELEALQQYKMVDALALVNKHRLKRFKATGHYDCEKEYPLPDELLKS